ncbi:MAG: group II intron reverse transcriptase/maturase [Nitrospirae bacterium]|nr:group II intron reverse transcriptase/maturase [Nitrospirota bacterium]MCL5285665.1 group II intron reverse transcriptase/maturase [Nitrospirota bacterium]
MGRSQQSCAPSDLPFEEWSQIPWDQFEKRVQKLQTRIAKAIRERKFGKARALQNILTRSLAARALAVRRVTTNKGAKTPGVDRVRWSTAKQKMKALKKLSKRREYHALPLRRVYIPKRNGKLRPLGIPTMLDRAMQALYLLALLPVAEEEAYPHSYGFRPYRSTADAIEQTFKLLSRSDAPVWVLEGDIVGCFDNISHDWLLRNVFLDRKMLHEWLTSGFIDRHSLYPTLAGTPQGDIVSPTAANIALSGLGPFLESRFPSSHRVNIVIYADDFVVTGASKEILEQEVRPAVELFLRERGLELSQEKTRVVHIAEGFDFLGQNVRKYDGKLLITPAWKNVQALLDKVRDIVNQSKAKTQEWLIEKLNPILRGWAMFHRHICAKETYQWVDKVIFRMIWRWAKRRHSNKGARWVKKRYFHRIGTRNWVFASEATEKHCLYNTASTPIRRHVKIKGHANPFHPDWFPYFSQRKSTAKIRRELDTFFGGTIGTPINRGQLPALEGSSAS